MDNEIEEPQPIIDDYILTKQKFSSFVESVVCTSKGDISYIDATVTIAEMLGIELSDAQKYITPSLRDAIRNQAIEERLVRKSAMLEYDEKMAHRQNRRVTLPIDSALFQ